MSALPAGLSRGIALFLLAVSPVAALGEDVQAAARPKVIALVAAVGAKFNIAHETRSTGSRLDNYRRSSVDAPGDVLNRVVLQALDKEIEQVRPGSQRIYLSLDSERMDAVPANQRGDVAIARVVRELEKMPQRSEWDRIVVVTPAYRAFEADGVASRLQGLGVSMHPLQRGMSMFFNFPSLYDSAYGEDAITPDDKVVRTQVYLAPYAYLAVYVLDPRTFEVLDRQERFDNRKVVDPLAGVLDLGRMVSKEFLAQQAVRVIEQSIHEALARTELTGKVEVREVREVNPVPGSAARRPRQVVE